MTQAANLAALGSPGTTTGFKNRIINGGMTIDQRNAGASVTPTNFTYNLDRWGATLTQASKFTVQQNAGAVTPPVGFTKYLGVTSSSAYSVGSTDRFGIFQVIEGFNAADLGWGTANAKTVTLSFQVYSSLTGTFSGSIRSYSGTDTSYPFTYSVPVANTWTQISVTIAGPTTGTWATDNSGFAYIFFGLGTGSTYNGTANTWSTGNYWSVASSVSVVGTSGATFYITGVQLEVGTTATNFDFRSYGTELALCFRYFQALGGTGGADALGIGFGAGTTVYTQGMLFQPMRTTPTISYLGSIGGLYLTTVSVGGSYSSGFTTAGTGTASYYIYGDGGASFATYSCVHFRTSITGSKLTASAEL